MRSGGKTMSQEKKRQITIEIPENVGRYILLDLPAAIERLRQTGFRAIASAPTAFSLVTVPYK